MAKKNEVVEVEQKEVTLFEKMFARDVNDKLEVKDNGRVKLSYLSWAWAWAEVKKVDPNATYKIHDFPMIRPDKQGIVEGVFVPYLETATGYFVTVSVTINNHTLSETLPVMDEKNAPLGTTMMAWNPAKKGTKMEVVTPTPTSFEINKSHKRCLVKAIALHGLGLYVYAGEDLPEEAQKEKEEEKQQPKKQTPPQDKQKQETKKETKKAEDLPQYNPISIKTISLISVFDEEIASKTGKVPFQPVQLLVKNPNFTYDDLGGLKEEDGQKLLKHLEAWINKLNGSDK